MGRGGGGRWAAAGGGGPGGRGTVGAGGEVAVADPWLEPRGNGMWAVTAEVSTGADVGPDSMVRRELGTISGTTGTFPLLGSSVTVR